MVLGRRIGTMGIVVEVRGDRGWSDVLVDGVRVLAVVGVVMVLIIVVVTVVDVVLEAPVTPASLGSVQFLPCQAQPSPLHWQ